MIYTLLCVVVISFIQCNTPETIEKSASEEDVPKDTVSVCDTMGTTALSTLNSEITCPKCGHKKMETMPTEVCLLKYTCEKCKETLCPKKGDCCVFCTYGTKKCPSMQD